MSRHELLGCQAHRCRHLPSRGQGFGGRCGEIMLVIFHLGPTQLLIVKPVTRRNKILDGILRRNIDKDLISAIAHFIEILFIFVDDIPTGPLYV